MSELFTARPMCSQKKPKYRYFDEKVAPDDTDLPIQFTPTGAHKVRVIPRLKRLLEQFYDDVFRYLLNSRAVTRNLRKINTTNLHHHPGPAPFCRSIPFCSGTWDQFFERLKFSLKFGRERAR